MGGWEFMSKLKNKELRIFIIIGSSISFISFSEILRFHSERLQH